MGLREARPHIEVTVVEVGALEEEVARSAPHLVISSPPIPENALGRTLSWVELSPYPDRHSRICVAGNYRESLNPSLEELLEVADETEGLVSKNHLSDAEAERR